MICLSPCQLGKEKHSGELAVVVAVFWGICPQDVKQGFQNKGLTIHCCCQSPGQIRVKSLLFKNLEARMSRNKITKVRL